MAQQEAHLQFCQDGQDIGGDFFRSQDATEVRAWTEDSTCLGAVTVGPDGQWQASASDVCSWTDYQDKYGTWQAALAALLALDGNHRLIPEADWA